MTTPREFAAALAKTQPNAIRRIKAVRAEFGLSLGESKRVVMAADGCEVDATTERVVKAMETVVDLDAMITTMEGWYQPEAISDPLLVSVTVPVLVYRGWLRQLKRLAGYE
jgi:DNA-binding transcriptional LysR family regulator